MDKFRKVSKDSIVSLHLHGGRGLNVQSSCCCSVSSGSSSSHLFTNPLCTSSSNEWLPCRKDIEPTKIKVLNFDREDFAQRGKKKRPLVASPKKKINSLKKRLSLNDFASALEEIVPNSILFATVPKPKSDFVREIITEWARETDVEVTSIENLIKLSKTKVEFLQNLSLLSIEKIRQIEVCNRGQCCNEQWYLCRKGVITTSKVHWVITKMKKVRKGRGGVVNIWSLKKKFLQ